MLFLCLFKPALNIWKRGPGACLERPKPLANLKEVSSEVFPGKIALPFSSAHTNVVFAAQVSAWY